MNKSRFRIVADWLEDNWVEASSGVCAFLFGIFALVFSDEVLAWFGFEEMTRTRVRFAAFFGLILTGIGYFVFFVWSLAIKDRASKLKVRVHELEDEARLLTENIRNLLDGYLFNLARHKLTFGTKPMKSERITLYVDDSGKCFVPVGRYASNPTYQSRGRTSYPIGQGCICKAWRDGWFFANDFPDPVTDTEQYLKKHTEYGVPKTTALNLTMKSRLYFACRILDDKERHPVAVLVVESVESDRFSEEELRGALSNGEQRYLTDVISTLKPYIALPSDAEKAGF